MKKNLKKHSNIYLALAVCLAAIGMGALIGFVTPEKEDAEDFSRVTIHWSAEQTEAPLTQDANVGVTGIEDERVYTESETQTEENLPFTGNFALPMGTDILKDYSNGEMVESKTMGDWRVHNGIDFAGSAGNDVFAVSQGTVTKVYSDSFWGTVVEIDHGNGMTARYCGMKEGSCLPEGTEVEKYDKIGTLGHIPVEIGEEDHLHFEILIDGSYTDPLKALNKLGDNG